MTLVYQTPGVYFERADARAPAIGPLRTDIAGFVGIASRGLVDVPVAIESWRQFEAHFGGFSGPGFLSYAVRGFFENGGRRCWVVRVASRDPVGGCREAAAIARDTATSPAWRIRASSPGVWGNALRIRVAETHAVQTVTLPGGSPIFSRVPSVSGFARGTHVRISQPGAPAVHRVVSHADALEGRLWWVHPRPEMRLPYDRPLAGFDPDSPLLVESVEYTIAVRNGAVTLFVQPGLSLVRENDTYGPRVLPPLQPPLDLKEGQLPATPVPVVIEDLRPAGPHVERLDAAGDWIRLEGGADGLALLEPNDFIGEPAAPDDSDDARAVKERGLEQLAAVSEVAVIAVPDVHAQPAVVFPQAPPLCVPDPCLGLESPAEGTPPEPRERPPRFRDAEIHRVQAAAVALCERLRDRFAVLDTPFETASDARLGIPSALDWRSRFDSKYAALYYPWLDVVDPLRAMAGLTRPVPPCGHVAGQYARGDVAIGVHKAPANYPLEWVQDVTARPSDEVHGLLNSRGINLVKLAPARRIRIMGARTVSSDYDWRFVNVRRLLMKLEKAIYLALAWVVFEPNSTITRTKVQMVLTTYLFSQWEIGALVGVSAEEAFFVRCDESNNPPRIRDAGQLVAEVGVAPSVPLEFIVLRVGRVGHELEVEEQGVRGR